MRGVFHRFEAGEEILDPGSLRNGKLFKYYNRETMAAVATAASLFSETPPPADTPFVYATGETESCKFFELIRQKVDCEHFSSRFYVDEILPRISPLVQFKMMRNMVSCMVAIENGLKGDNSLILDSASALLYAALSSPYSGEVIIGAGKMYADDVVECGLAFVLPSELAGHRMLGSDSRAIDFFREEVWR